MQDVMVVGAGPAGLALAAACGARGMRTAVVAPDPFAGFTNNFGVWVDEVAQAGFADCLEHSWPTTVVGFGRGRTRTFPRAYGRIDNQLLLQRLIERCEAGGVTFVAGEAERVEHGRDRSELRLISGERVEARLTFDATGHAPRLVSVPIEDRVAAQVAYGLEIEVRGQSLDPSRMILMDFDDAHLPAGEDRGVPTFLYAMPLARDRAFLEETSLVARPPVDIALLERRLALRMAALGVEARVVRSVERCFIPMGGGLPRMPQRVIGFGAAARMVHPATGYMMNRSLLRAPLVARAAEEALRVEDPHRAAAHVWAAVWPPDRVKSWALFRLGMDILTAMDTTSTQDFFSAFFQLPTDRWVQFLSGEATAGEVRSAMAGLFQRMPIRLKSRIVWRSLGWLLAPHRN